MSLRTGRRSDQEGRLRAREGDSYLLALGLAGLALYLLLAIIAITAELAVGWKWALFAIPALLLALAARYAIRYFLT